MFHPQLLPVTITLTLAFVALALGAWVLFRRWAKLRKRTRWAVFAALAVFEALLWLNIYAWFIEPASLAVRRV